MHSEILEQVDAVRHSLSKNRDGLLDKIARLPGDISHCVVAARGTSDNAARYAKYVWGARNNLKVGLATPSLYSLYETPPSLENALVVGISQSGESPDLVSVLEEARRQNRPTVTITNHPSSPLAQTADLVIDICAGDEAAVAATKSYTTQLVAVAAISAALAGSSLDSLNKLPLLLEQVIETESAIADMIDQAIDSDRCVVLGRGYHYGTAHEWALKLQETTYITAQPYSTADFLHGPSAAVDSDVPVLVVAAEGPSLPSVIEVAGRLRERGCHVVAITDTPDVPADQVIRILKTEEWLSPIIAAPALQLHVYYLSLASGQDPDHPRGLSKVTRTL